jgi:small subunit ribosomal protein S15
MIKSKKNNLEKPVWLKYTEDEVKAIILKLANKGITAEKIGLILRDQYGIPKVKLYNLKIKRILNENKKYQEPTILNLKKKLDSILEHNKKFRHDNPAKRSEIITKAKLKKAEDYENRKL